MTKSEIKTKYDSLYHLYERLGKNVKEALIQFLKENNIDYLDVEFRVKDFKSFYKKIERKEYKDPFEDMQDICGLRVINYYQSDLDKITEIIKNEFSVSESVDKQSELDDDRFGYRSYHYIVSLKKEWMMAPTFRGLENINFEIQARTILMHGWAAINHKLLYKHEDDVPKPFKRDLFRLSALVELADEQFERLRLEREEYIKDVVVKTEEGDVILDSSKKLNVDTLLALLNTYFPDRVGEEMSSMILDKIRACNLDLSEFHEKLLIALPYLSSIEEEELTLDTNEYDEKAWNLHAIVMTILDLTIEGHIEKHNYPPGIAEIAYKYRSKINS